MLGTLRNFPCDGSDESIALEQQIKNLIRSLTSVHSSARWSMPVELNNVLPTRRPSSASRSNRLWIVLRRSLRCIVSAFYMTAQAMGQLWFPKLHMRTVLNFPFAMAPKDLINPRIWLRFRLHQIGFCDVIHTWPCGLFLWSEFMCCVFDNFTSICTDDIDITSILKRSDCRACTPKQTHRCKDKFKCRCNFEIGIDAGIDADMHVAMWPPYTMWVLW